MNKDFIPTIQNDYIYLDSNGGSPILPPVQDMIITLMNHPLNPSATHYLGQQANGFVEDARDSLKKYLNCQKDYEIIFTSSGSEANNLAIKSFDENTLYICTATEHKSVLLPIISNKNYIVVSVDQSGLVNIDELLTIIKENKEKKIFLSIIYVNNETGAINDLEDIIKKVRSEHNDIVIHSDMGQALGKLDINDLNFQKLDIDCATIIGYKFGAIIGAGALIYKKNMQIKPIILGGGQEHNLRAGTENVMAIYSIKIALDYWYINNNQNDKYELQNYLEQKLKSIIKSENLIIFSENVKRAWNTSYFAIIGLDSKIQLMFLNTNKIYVGTGSACSAGLDEDSYVLKAMGFDEKINKYAIRISFNAFSTKNHIDILIEKLQQLYRKFNG